jgi:hypothetical protein
MPKAIPREKPDEVEQHQLETLHAVIGEQVLYALGKPDNLLKVQVRPLWEDRYRVNILVGQDAACARVANSYFVVVDSEGILTSCTPKIVRRASSPAGEARAKI